MDRPPRVRVDRPPDKAASRRAQIDLFASGASPGAASPRVPDGSGPAAAEFVRPLRGRVFSVTELTRALKGVLEAEYPRVAVQGEVSNFRRHTSGHWYFSLKDAGARLAAVIFRSDAARVPFEVRDGLSVIATGRITVYEPRGEYQIVCDVIEPEGAGARAMALEALKARLRAEGLFDEARKRRLPFIARGIGVATSVRGAALYDFLKVLNERLPIPVVVADCRVQGDGAAGDIARAVQRLAGCGRVDVIVVTRGGGSTEDLWAFNEEAVVRAIAAAGVPVVSAVGHEVDVTLSDFAADARAATPTHAAKLLAPSRVDLLAQLAEKRARIASSVRRLHLLRAQEMRLVGARVVDPRRRLAERRLRLDDLSDRAAAQLRRRLLAARDGFAAISVRIGRLHPRARLGRTREALLAHERALLRATVRLRAMRDRLLLVRGRLEAAAPATALVYRGDRVVRSIAQVAAGDAVRVELPDGAFDADVTRIGSRSDGSI